MIGWHGLVELGHPRVDEEDQIDDHVSHRSSAPWAFYRCTP
jgi:hypothetical protein